MTTRHNDREQDEARFADLCRIHSLRFEKRRSRYGFTAHDFSAAGLRAALAFAEGFDRASDMRRRFTR